MGLAIGDARLGMSLLRHVIQGLEQKVLEVKVFYRLR